MLKMKLRNGHNLAYIRVALGVKTRVQLLTKSKAKEEMKMND